MKPSAVPGAWRNPVREKDVRELASELRLNKGTTLLLKRSVEKGGKMEVDGISAIDAVSAKSSLSGTVAAGRIAKQLNTKAAVARIARHRAADSAFSSQLPQDLQDLLAAAATSPDDLPLDPVQQVRRMGISSSIGLSLDTGCNGIPISWYYCCSLLCI